MRAYKFPHKQRGFLGGFFNKIDKAIRPFYKAAAVIGATYVGAEFGLGPQALGAASAVVYGSNEVPPGGLDTGGSAPPRPAYAYAGPMVGSFSPNANGAGWGVATGGAAFQSGSAPPPTPFYKNPFFLVGAAVVVFIGGILAFRR